VGYVHNAMEVTFWEDKWDEYKGDGVNLVAYISVGDNYVVNAKEGNEKRWIFTLYYICIQTSFMVSNLSLAHGGNNFGQVT
jgi:hypothetical protein